MAQVKWRYCGRRANTQTDIGGGILSLAISLPVGVYGVVEKIRVLGPATNTTLWVGVFDEDRTLSALELASVAAGVSRTWNGPTISGAVSTHAVPASSENLKLGAAEYLTAQSGNSANGESLTIEVYMLLSAPCIPTWDTTGSGGTPSLGASSISAANTLKPVVA